MKKLILFIAIICSVSISLMAQDITTIDVKSSTKTIFELKYNGNIVTLDGKDRHIGNKFTINVTDSPYEYVLRCTSEYGTKYLLFNQQDLSFSNIRVIIDWTSGKTVMRLKN